MALKGYDGVKAPGSDRPRVLGGHLNTCRTLRDAFYAHSNRPLDSNVHASLSFQFTLPELSFAIWIVPKLAAWSLAVERESAGR